MATTGADAAVRRLAIVRRLEAAGFRAWPATATAFDGTWAVRLTKGSSAKRLNSVNPLDPSDHADLEDRIARAQARFAEFGRPLLFRQSPLAPKVLVEHLDGAGWSSFGESIVFTGDLGAIDLSGAVDRIPIHDPARYVEASLRVHRRGDDARAGLAAILDAIEPPTALFVQEDADERPLAVALAVHDADLAGVLDVAVDEAVRGQGIGRALVAAALRHVQHKGARTGWLQVEAGNAAGLALYRRLGFVEAYRYVYRAPPAASAGST
ncbi:GCN5 family acetyltransferase [Aureimonas sp. Leaf454]|uniref:GNAT family N-acetyltransferase n=1 Tax=Aureimonas sp. Leaf454 TaxID=1736381 RepID=UPI0006FFE0D1|nr:GNAT family N-acetyltransferase [Aureimonas sp. Leaf454]KQT44372.1 GCN5 family acetyltransferase [Aureimonas sp. Leaf454]